MSNPRVLIAQRIPIENVIGVAYSVGLIIFLRVLIGMVDGSFWGHLDRLVAESRVIVDNPRGTHDGGSDTVVYPVDYGYLEDTSSMDGEGIDVFVGSDPCDIIDAIICTVDLVKRDSEIKVLIGCTEDDKQSILRFYESFSPMRPLLIRRAESF